MLTFDITREFWEGSTIVKVRNAKRVLVSVSPDQIMPGVLKLYQDNYTVLVFGVTDDAGTVSVISESIESKTHNRDEPTEAWVRDIDPDTPTDDKWLIGIHGWRQVDKIFDENPEATSVYVRVTNSINPDKLADGVDFPNEGITAESLEAEFLRRDASIKYLKELFDGEGVHNVLEEAEIDTDQIVDDAVTTSKLDDKSITEEKLADGSVTTAKIAGDSANRVPGAVTTEKIADKAVTYDKLSDDVRADIATGGGGGGIAAVNTGNTLTGDGTIIDPLDVADGGITESKLSAYVVNQLKSESNNVPDGGTTGQALSKKSDTDGDVERSDFLKFVTTSGQSNGDGTAGNPLSISAALTQGTRDGVKYLDFIIGQLEHPVTSGGGEDRLFPDPGSTISINNLLTDARIEKRVQILFTQNVPGNLLTFNLPETPNTCLLYTSPSPRDRQKSRMPSSA